MQVTLDDKWIEHLVELPESGMGYQCVQVRLRDGRKPDGSSLESKQDCDRK